MIDCVVCLQQMKPPVKVLSCGHSFCLRCIRQIRRQSSSAFGQKYNKMSCPTCRHETPLPRGRASMLPNNYALHDILEMQNNQMSKDKNDTCSAGEQTNKDEINNSITPSSITSSESISNVFYQEEIVNDDDDENGYEAEDWWDDVAHEEEESNFNGNWFCPNELCYYYNFSFRTVCRWCRTSRSFNFENYQPISNRIDQVLTILNQENPI